MKLSIVLSRISKFILSFTGIIFLFSLFQKLAYSPDDTYIYLQYARNIASGDGFSFNPGEQSFGVTSPLWTLLLTVPYFFSIDGFWFAKFADLLCALASLLLFFRLTKIFFGENLLLRSIAVSVFALNPWFIRASFTGMESSLAALHVITVFYFFYSQHYFLAFLFEGFLFLVRPEAFILFFILLFASYLKMKSDSSEGVHSDKPLFKTLVLNSSATAIIVLPFLFFAYLNFRTIFPNTALGKSSFIFSVASVMQQTTEVFRVFGGFSPVELCLAGLFFINIFFRKKFKDYWMQFTWIACILLLYIFTNAGVMSRYFLIIYPSVVLLGIKFIEKVPFRKTAVVLTLILSLSYSQFIFYKFVKPNTDNFTQGVQECFIPLGKWIAANTEIDCKILVTDVGAIGYFADRKIIDGAALVNHDLSLNKKINSIPSADRNFNYKLLDIITADYIVDRDTTPVNHIFSFKDYKLEQKVTFIFPSLTVLGGRQSYYKIYKVFH